MTVLIVIYDPIDGTPVRDGAIRSLAQAYVDRINNNFDEEDLAINVASAPLIDAFRLALRRRELTADRITFVYRTRRHAHNGGIAINDIVIRHDQEGNFAEWPEGFCDYHDGIMMDLLGWRELDAADEG